MSTSENIIDKNSDKYKILLKLINNILVTPIPQFICNNQQNVC